MMNLNEILVNIGVSLLAITPVYFYCVLRSRQNLLQEFTLIMIFLELDLTLSIFEREQLQDCISELEKTKKYLEDKMWKLKWCVWINLDKWLEKAEANIWAGGKS